MPHVYEDEFASLGTSLHEMLDLQRVDPTYHLVFEDGSQLSLTSDIKEMQDQLEAIEPDSFQGFLRYTGLESHIKFETCFTPLTWHKRYNLMKGSTHGLCHNLTQLGYFRPSNRHPRYPNLYFAGASIRPGTGMPTALISARLAAQRMLEDIR
jgi:phytoene dehydrogenase-like protein